MTWNITADSCGGNIKADSCGVNITADMNITSDNCGVSITANRQLDPMADSYGAESQVSTADNLSATKHSIIAYRNMDIAQFVFPFNNEVHVGLACVLRV